MQIVRALMLGVWSLAGTVALTEDTIHKSRIAALKKDNVDFCKLAIQRSSIELLNSAGINAAGAACYAGSSCLSLFLGFHKQNINLTMYKGFNPLHHVVKKSNVTTVATLIYQRDINVNWVCKGVTALILSMKQREGQATDIARMLLGNDEINANMISNHGTALHEAIALHEPTDTEDEQIRELVFCRSSELVQGLLEHPEDYKGRTPLALAAQYGYRGIVQQLLEHNPTRINHKCPDGRTPLSLAIDLRLPSGNVMALWGAKSPNRRFPARKNGH